MTEKIFKILEDTEQPHNEQTKSTLLQAHFDTQMLARQSQRQRQQPNVFRNPQPFSSLQHQYFPHFHSQTSAAPNAAGLMMNKGHHQQIQFQRQIQQQQIQKNKLLQ